MENGETFKRECGGCTKCCEGYFYGYANGHKFGVLDGVRKPCFFVEQGVGCKDYENRPTNPCKNYKCQWLINPDVPEEFRPDKVDVMVTKKGRSYFAATDAGDNPSDEVKLWWLEYAKKNNLNLSYTLSTEPNRLFYGSDRLRETLLYSQQDRQPGEPLRDEILAKKNQDSLE